MHAVLTLESNSGSSHVPWSISTLRVPLDDPQAMQAFVPKLQVSYIALKTF